MFVIFSEVVVMPNLPLNPVDHYFYVCESGWGETEEVFKTVFGGRVFARILGLEVESLIVAGAMQAELFIYQEKKHKFEHISVESLVEYPVTAPMNEELLIYIASEKKWWKKKKKQKFQNE